MNKTALVVGATGLVGKELTQQLLSDDRYQQVHVFVRRKIGAIRELLSPWIRYFQWQRFPTINQLTI